MKPRPKRKLVPLNPFERSQTIPSIIIAKQVWRLMLKEGKLPVYREVELTEDMLVAICEHERHLTRVFIVADRIKHGEVGGSESAIALVVEPPEKIAGALEALRTEYGERKPRLDVEFIEKVHDAIQEQYWEEFLKMYDKPTSAQEWCHNGNIHSTKEDIASSLMCYSKAMELEPQNPMFHFARAQFYFIHAHDARSAFEDIENAMLLTKPTNYHRLMIQHSLRVKVCFALSDTEGMMGSLRTSLGIHRHLLEDFEVDAAGWVSFGNGAAVNVVTLKESLSELINFTKNVLGDELGIGCRAELQNILREFQRLNDML